MIDFPAYNFDCLNEADVREEIVAPLIRHLGYRAGTEHDVLREQALTYNRTQLGRRKDTDQVLRGRADYICAAGGRVRWVIEAKGPEHPIDAETEAQAWSYANHPEVRAVYYVLTNGREFKLFVTNRGPDKALLFECSYAELASNLQRIENTLGPTQLLREHPDIQIDTGIPLAPGLRSTARITGGHMAIESISIPALGPITQLVNTVCGGSVERRHDGTLYVVFEARMPVNAVQQANILVGLNEIELFTTDLTISTDENRPTILYGGRDVSFDRGMELYDILNWKSNTLPVQLDANISWLARGHLDGHTFIGSYESAMFLKGNLLHALVEISGRFEVHVI